LLHRHQNIARFTSRPPNQNSSQSFRVWRRHSNRGEMRAESTRGSASRPDRRARSREGPTRSAPSIGGIAVRGVEIGRSMFWRSRRLVDAGPLMYRARDASGRDWWWSPRGEPDSARDCRVAPRDRRVARRDLSSFATRTCSCAEEWARVAPIILGARAGSPRAGFRPPRARFGLKRAGVASKRAEPRSIRGDSRLRRAGTSRRSADVSSSVPDVRQPTLRHELRNCARNHSVVLLRSQAERRARRIRGWHSRDCLTT